MYIHKVYYRAIQCDFLSPFQNSVKTLGVIIIPIVVFFAQKFSETATQTQIVHMAVLATILIVLIFSLMFSIAPIVRDVLYRNYDKYDEFIYDVRQLKLFYATRSNS